MKPHLARLALAAFGFGLVANAAMAHEFTTALYVTGENRAQRLAEAVNGFLLAADERDGHPAETSDGHLGGVDVQILPLPEAMAASVTGLNGTAQIPPDVMVILGDAPVPAAVLAELGFEGSVVPSGALPDSWAADDSAGSFAQRYRSAYGAEPSVAAAQGYNAARRLDIAIRPLGGVSPRAALDAALAETEGGVNWNRGTQ